MFISASLNTVISASGWRRRNYGVFHRVEAVRSRLHFDKSLGETRFNIHAQELITSCDWTRTQNFYKPPKKTLKSAFYQHFSENILHNDSWSFM